MGAILMIIKAVMLIAGAFAGFLALATLLGVDLAPIGEVGGCNARQLRSCFMMIV